MTLSPADLAMCIKLSALAYDYVAEKQNPAPDFSMIAMTWEALQTAMDKLPVDMRLFLAREAGR